MARPQKRYVSAWHLGGLCSCCEDPERLKSFGGVEFADLDDKEKVWVSKFFEEL
jgi:hypothetical protein